MFFSTQEQSIQNQQITERQAFKDIESGKLYFLRSTFINCTAQNGTTGGGAICAQVNVPVIIDTCLFSKCICLSNIGGAIFCESDSFDLFQSCFHCCAASSVGNSFAALVSTSSQIQILFSTITQCSEREKPKGQFSFVLASGLQSFRLSNSSHNGLDSLSSEPTSGLFSNFINVQIEYSTYANNSGFSTVKIQNGLFPAISYSNFHQNLARKAVVSMVVSGLGTITSCTWVENQGEPIIAVNCSNQVIDCFSDVGTPYLNQVSSFDTVAIKHLDFAFCGVPSKKQIILEIEQNVIYYIIDLVVGLLVISALGIYYGIRHCRSRPQQHQQIP